VNLRAPRRRVAGVLLIAVLGVALLKVVRPVVFPLPMDRCGSKRFDQAAWLDSARAYSRAAVRGCMVDDLLRKRPLYGMTRPQVQALLGVPPATDYFETYDLVYWLGPERGMISIDSEWLVIKLDTGGRVSDAHLVTD
jgi:outer membrane protein assembly factor BamE (lipoprotein component of BamABCDE complex)